MEIQLASAFFITYAKDRVRREAAHKEKVIPLYRHKKLAASQKGLQVLCLLSASWGVFVLPVHAQSLPLDEIIVTATKRAENLQDVPISITVFTQEKLETLRPEGLEDLGKHVSNMWLPGSTEAGQSQISIRGISAGISKSSGRSVGVYIDGVYVNADTALDVDLDNIAFVEVLKGPQGTLFGRDTIGGAINITTQAPGNTSSAHVLAELGNQGHKRLALRADLPLVKDVLALRISAQKLDRDGYILNAFNGEKAGAVDHFSASGQAYYTPSDRFDAQLVYQYQSRDDRPNTMGEAITSIGSDTIPYTINVDQTEIQTQKQHRISLNTNTHFDNGFTLSTVSGFSDVEDFYIQDGDRLPIPITIARFDSMSREFSQEVRLTSPEYDRFNYLVGAYYLNTEWDYSPTFPLMGEAFLEQVFFIPPAFQPADELDGQRVIADVESFAIFTHVNVKLSDKLSAFGGLRYTQDTKIIDYSIFGEVFALFTLTALNEVSRVKDTPLSWTFGTRYAVTDTVNSYASVSRGYRSASIKDDFISQADIDAGTGFFTQPEYLTNYEIGVKTLLFGGKIRANASAFYMDYTDIQVAVSREPFLFLRSLTNAAEAHIQGFELEVEGQITPELRISTAFGYVKTRYDVFEPSPGVDLSGTGFGIAPDWTLSATVDYVRPLAGGGSWSVHADYTDRRAPDDFAPQTHPLSFVGDYAVSNLSTGYAAKNGKWKAKIWVNNVFDVNKPSVNFLWGSGLGPLIENETVRYEPPRTYGLTLAYMLGGS